MARQSPEIGPVVDVEHHLAAVRLGDADRLPLGSGSAVTGEMRAGDNDRAGRGDEGLVDVPLVQRHVGAVGAHEDHRRDAFGLDRKQNQRSEARGVRLHALDRHALAHELFADEGAHLLAADTGQQRRLQPKPRRADRDVGRAAADGLGEGCDVFQARPDLLAVEIDGRASDRDDVERAGGFIRWCDHSDLPLSLSPRLGRRRG